jgi:hypothetical protein
VNNHPSQVVNDVGSIRSAEDRHIPDRRAFTPESLFRKFMLAIPFVPSENILEFAAVAKYSKDLFSWDHQQRARSIPD